ncbi:PA14 domain-containing protein [Chitinophaga filiformis]|uniref:PA14 domain-containing protein n=1 Tax=Chitinophaga filiformis TaxID=104663 RepID=UPI001F35392D|nr:PA14 domain-containing protein [Chitinophaga filiformis]MCF6405194.1 PA14 domain-containing protein [Chitinophaga filiformis]
MILEIVARHKKAFAIMMLTLLYCDAVLPAYAFAPRRVDHRSYTGRRNALIPAKEPAPVVGTSKSGPAKTPAKPLLKAKEAVAIGGPGQPESQAFHSVNHDNMVDLFTGDFSYSIPLMDVGGYPLAIGYNSGISMDQEASWVGLGWNINPGAITRNMRGLPDDFNGRDTIQKIASVKENKTVGVTVGADVEITGLSDYAKFGAGASLGILHNSYKGIGLETSVNTSISAGSNSMGWFTTGLSVTNSSQEGLTIGRSLAYKFADAQAREKGGLGGSVSMGWGYNSREGLKALSFSAGLRQYTMDDKNRAAVQSSNISSYISFAHPAFTPSINMPYTNTLYNYTAKVGWEAQVIHPSLSVSGYVSKQRIAPEDKRTALPAYGYLNYHTANGNEGALLDYNREKEIAYREKPTVPNIAVPSYTYDVFSISGEGTGGMFRAYRGDLGFIYDHAVKTRDNSTRGSVDIGLGSLVHAGVDLGITRAYSQSGPWTEQNPLATTIAFRKPDKLFESVYFRNPGEKTINTRAFYNAIGGEDVVSVDLYQAGNSSAVIETANRLNVYKNKRFAGNKQLTSANVYKTERDKRGQVISYLTAAEASVAGLSKYIDNYASNVYSIGNCGNTFPDDVNGNGVGLRGEYFKGRKFETKLFERTDPTINFNNIDEINQNLPAGAAQLGNDFSVRWTGRVKVASSGRYRFSTNSDDGVRVYLNDTLIIDRWNDHGNTKDTAWVNLVADQLYNIKAEYYQARGRVIMKLQWRPLATTEVVIPTASLYLMPDKDTFVVGTNLSKEKRVNDFRKADHISEIDVLNTDGRRYVYGIPVYNLKQRDLTFSVAAGTGRRAEGLVKYTPGVDNTVNNNKGNDNYFNSEEMPAYAHSFLLTGILSPDYTDLTGDGISDDDPGNAIKFNYTKVAGIKNPYKWRSPANDSASYSEGLLTDNRDDKGSYIAGNKELWYLHSIESKNMIATFKLTDRDDLFPITEDGVKQSARVAKKLEEINLYNKADFQKYNTAARPVKTVHFEYNYELCPGSNRGINTTGKLTLKRIWFTYNGNDKGKRNPYVFAYNSFNPPYNSKAYDRWGNYKDNVQNPGATTNNPIYNGEYPYSLRDSAQMARNAAAWTLDSIILPSGAHMKIDYESDEYAYVQHKRAAQMFHVAGLSASKPNATSDLSNSLYGLIDYLYVAVNVPKPVSSNEEVYRRYLEGMDKIYFKLSVQVPSDKFGAGNEYVPVYATLDDSYGFFNNGSTIWFKVRAIDAKGDVGDPLSVFSPMAQTALQYLRLNLPSKAYPGSDVGDNVDLGDAIKILLSQADNVTNTMVTYNVAARAKGWMKTIDTLRSLVRLNSPIYRKFGGGLRVKRIRIYDNWTKMTQQKESVYGTEYQYTTQLTTSAGVETISSGVASYEPALGGDENPWRQPIEYTQQAAVLAPVELGYTEYPLGESFFPAPSVGYRKVRARSINTKDVRSANGYQEYCFYTNYEFPVITDMTLLADGKKRFKPALANFLRINARHFVAVSQGFKIELNDMNGKPRSTAVYPETDADNPVSSTEFFYREDDPTATFRHLRNTVTTIAPNGTIDTTAVIGEDIELMTDMREHKSVTNANNFNLNSELFSFGMPPIMIIPTLWNLAQREEVKFRSVAVTKVINRHGILDSIVVADKGSRVTTRNLAYNSETGSVLLTSTQNLFDDPVYQFQWPSGWAYEGMSGAYKNLNVVLDDIYVNKGKITSGLGTATAATYFYSGDEILVASKVKTGGADCSPEIASFPVFSTLYAVDANVKAGGAPDIYLVDASGTPFTGNDVSLKIVRSGRRNMDVPVGVVTMLNNPIVKSGTTLKLVIDETSRVIKASVTEYKQDWQVADRKKQKAVCAN